jgi:hypothetical protein
MIAAIGANRSLTKGVAVSYFGPPATYKMDLVFGNRSHLRIPTSNQLSVFFDFVWLYLVEYNRVDVFTAGQDLREAALNVFVEFATLGCAVNEG